jgi:hypothetical protein
LNLALALDNQLLLHQQQQQQQQSLLLQQHAMPQAVQLQYYPRG